jgi:hypothetical protein
MTWSYCRSQHASMNWWQSFIAERQHGRLIVHVHANVCARFSPIVFATLTLRMSARSHEMTAAGPTGRGHQCGGVETGLSPALLR